MEQEASISIFGKLEALYQQLELETPKHEANPCGSCHQCCTATGISNQSLLEMELDYIAHRVGPELVLAFRAFASREKNSRGQYLFDLCPYYDLAAQACGIHAHRPFSCRAFGPYRVEGTAFPTNCVFIGHEKTVTKGRVFQEIPLAGAVRELSRTYWPLVGPRVVAHVNVANQMMIQQGEAEPQTHRPSDLIDAALVDLAHGDITSALAALQKEGPEAQEAFRLYNLGIALASLERRDEAAVVFDLCLDLAPDSWQLSYAIAVNSYHLKDETTAIGAFLKTVELNPLHALAWGFLGYIALSKHLDAEAVHFLSNACKMDPENALFRLRLGEVCSRSNQVELAREHLNLARTLVGPAGTAERAEALLESLPRKPIGSA